MGGCYGKGGIVVGSRFHHGGECGGMRFFTASSPGGRRLSALAVGRLEPENATHSQSSGEAVSLTPAVGLITLYMTVSRKSGRAEYAPLWRCGGGGGRKPTYREKNANTDVCVFFYFLAPGHGPGAAPPPLSR